MNMWMSEQRIRELADVVEGLEAGCAAGQFSMAEVAHPCGSPACIAGWAVAVFDSLPEVLTDARRRGHVSAAAVMNRARELLGLDYDEGIELFVPSGSAAECQAPLGSPNFVTPEVAAACLRHLADTGEVDWRAARQGRGGRVGS